MLIVMTCTRASGFCPEAVDVVEGLGDRAVLEEHHGVGYTDGHHVEERRAAERRPVRIRPGQESEGPRAVTEVGQETRAPVRRVVRRVGIDEVLLEVEAQMYGQGPMVGIESRVEMGDANRVLRTWLVDGVSRRVELRVIAVAEPVGSRVPFGSRRSGSSGRSQERVSARV